MSLNLYINLERKIDGLDPNSADHVLILKFEEKLTAVAKQLKVKPLKDYYVDDPDNLDLVIDDEKLLKELKSQVASPNWHNPADGLVTVKALKKYISDNPNKFNFQYGHWFNLIISELAHLEQVLMQANKQHVRFNVSIGQ